jgi:hypothetical protein
MGYPQGGEDPLIHPPQGSAQGRSIHIGTGIDPLGDREPGDLRPV